MSQDEKRIIPDIDILAVGCPICNQPPQRDCVDSIISGATLKVVSSRRFHPARVMIAQEEQMVKLFGKQLSNGEKWLICAYAYIFVCDSVSANSETLMGKAFSSVAVQSHFAKMAVEELHKDGLLSERAYKMFIEPPTHDQAN